MSALNPVLQIEQAIGGAFKAAIEAVLNDAISLTVDISKLFTNIYNYIANAITNFFSDVYTTVTKTLPNDVRNAIESVFKLEKQTIFSILPKTPDTALDAAVGLFDLGIATTLSAHLVGVIPELAYFTKHIGTTEIVKDVLDAVGISEMSGALFAIIIGSGFRELITQAIYYQIQPLRTPVQELVRTLWYGVRDMNYVKNELRYAGFNDNAISDTLATAYRPISPFILEKLIELQVLDEATAFKQLQMEGFDPRDVPALFQAFQNLAMNSFQNQAKSQVFLMYKDGMLDQNKAVEIMNAFAIPKIQQSWILTMANYQFQYEQKLLMQSLLINAFAKGELDATTTQQLLEQLGITADRASVLIKIKALQIAPTLPKTGKAQVLQDALKLTLNISA